MVINSNSTKHNEKNIEVFGRNGQRLAPTNSFTAETLVGRKNAVWIEKGKSLTVLRTKSDYKKRKKYIIAEEKRVCYICGRTISNDEIATIDHVDPKSRKGTDDRDNLRCCCKRCNEDKGKTSFLRYCDWIFSNKEIYDYVDFKHLDMERKKYIDRKGTKES